MPRVSLRSPRTLALATGITLALSLCATPGAFAANETTAYKGNAEFAPGADRITARPAATFFSINSVLAKLDRQRGRGPDAIRLAALSTPDIATDAPPAIKEAPTVGPEPFGLFTFRAPDGLLWRKWRGVEAGMTKEQAVLDQCRADAGSCPAHAAQFLRLINAVGAKSGRERLDEANRGVNAAIRYVSDFAQHGEADRWSTPLATFATAKGDCEDYAIAKYVALTAAGFPGEDLQLVLVRDRAVRQDHAVLAARLDGHWLILDNRFSNLLDDSEATRFTPLFAINHDGVHLFAAPYAKRVLPDEQNATAPATAGVEAPTWDGSEPAPIENYAGASNQLLLM